MLRPNTRIRKGTVPFAPTMLRMVPGRSGQSPSCASKSPLMSFLPALMAAWLLLCGVATAAEQPQTLRAGVAKKDITPTKPVTLSGYAGRKDLSQGVHDPLSARVLAFEQNGKRLVLVSTDLIGFYNQTSAIRKAILTACRLEPSELFLTAIHTHSGPTPTLDDSKGHANNVEYTKTLETQLADMVREAMQNMVPVQIGVGSGSSPVGVNRREPLPDSATKPNKVRLGRNPAVLTDREVQVLKISRAGTDELVAVVFAYPTHSTSLGPKNYVISGDVHGLAEQFVEGNLNHGVIAPAFAGASGDIDPWFRVLPKFDTANGWIPEPVLLGTMLGEEVVHVLSGIRKPAAGGPIKSSMKTLSLPGKPRGQVEAAADAAPVELTVTVARVGDVAVVGLGAEVFNAIGRAIKDASPFPHTLVITHCNGAAGYLPTQQSYADGGYEIQSSPFAPAAAEQVVQEVAKMLREL